MFRIFIKLYAYDEEVPLFKVMTYYVYCCFLLMKKS